MRSKVILLLLLLSTFFESRGFDNRLFIPAGDASNAYGSGSGGGGWGAGFRHTLAHEKALDSFARVLKIVFPISSKPCTPVF